MNVSASYVCICRGRIFSLIYTTKGRRIRPLQNWLTLFWSKQQFWLVESSFLVALPSHPFRSLALLPQSRFFVFFHAAVFVLIRFHCVVCVNKLLSHRNSCELSEILHCQVVEIINGKSPETSHGLCVFEIFFLLLTFTSLVLKRYSKYLLHGEGERRAKLNKGGKFIFISTKTQKCKKAKSEKRKGKERKGKKRKETKKEGKKVNKY